MNTELSSTKAEKLAKLLSSPRKLKAAGWKPIEHTKDWSSGVGYAHPDHNFVLFHKNGETSTHAGPEGTKKYHKLKAFAEHVVKTTGEKLKAPVRRHHTGTIELVKKDKSFTEFVKHHKAIGSHLKSAGFRMVRHNPYETVYRHPLGCRVYHQHNNGENWLEA